MTLASLLLRTLYKWLASLLFPSRPGDGYHTMLTARPADHIRYRRVIGHCFSTNALREQESIISPISLCSSPNYTKSPRQTLKQTFYLGTTWPSSISLEICLSANLFGASNQAKDIPGSARRRRCPSIVS